MLCYVMLYKVPTETDQGRSNGGYIGIYTPKISNCFVHVWDINTCLEIAMTS